MKLKLRNYLGELDIIKSALEKAAEKIEAEYCAHPDKPHGAHEYCYAQEVYEGLDAVERIYREECA